MLIPCRFVVCLILLLTATAPEFTKAQSNPPQFAQENNIDAATVLLRVRQVVARYFGADLEEITANTELVADLYADQMDVVEIIYILNGEYGVDIPLNAELSSIKDIAVHVHKAVTASSSRIRGYQPPPVVPSKPEPTYIQQIFYATNRRLTGRSDPGLIYGGERAKTNQLHYGVSEVSIPVLVHKKGREERPSVWKLQWRENPEKHIVLQSVQPMSRDRFLLKLNARLDSANAPGAQDAMIFIHGFNTTFENATRRTAQMAYDLDFPGVPILFSWPSNGNIRAYLSDREDAEWSVPYMERFVTELIDRSRVERLHLIAHSMGSQAMIRTLHMIALQRTADAPPLFENVILAAPDFDAQRFSEQLAPRIVSLAKRWTLYASDKDVALKAATAFSAKRLGLPLPLVENVDTIDASGIEVTPWSLPQRHAYHASKQRIISDLVSLLRGHGPDVRNLVSRQHAGLSYWALVPPR